SIFTIYSAFGGRGNPYGWSCIALTLTDLDRAAEALRETPEKYQGDQGQIQLARDLKINSLSYLYSAFGSRGNPYGWSYIALTLTDLDKVASLLKKGPDRYRNPWLDRIGRPCPGNWLYH
ncbi:unnamed protein product, partial [marine sediment metagenome]